jgi:2-methylcitrate dehydratase PrpD
MVILPRVLKRERKSSNRSISGRWTFCHGGSIYLVKMNMTWTIVSSCGCCCCSHIVVDFIVTVAAAKHANKEIETVAIHVSRQALQVFTTVVVLVVVVVAVVTVI